MQARKLGRGSFGSAVGVLFTLLAAGSQAASAEQSGRLTYSRDIAPIVYDNCLECHRPGNGIPIIFSDYSDLRPWAKEIRSAVSNRIMPPWHAEEAVGEWRNDRRLAQEEIDRIVKWVDTGAIEGDPEDLPPMPEFETGWRIGEPDQIFQMHKPQYLPPELEDEYRYVPIPTRFEEDRWIEAAEIQPGNRDVVHHVLVLVSSLEGMLGFSEDKAFRGGLGGFAPGTAPLIAGEDQGFLVPAGSILILQIHYHKEKGLEAWDLSRVGVRFADHVVRTQMRFGYVGYFDFTIPPREPAHVVEATVPQRRDVLIHTLIPHMHYRGKEMRMWIRQPDGRTDELIHVSKYDFNFQTLYELKDPYLVREGAEFTVRATYDNSARNGANPDPDASVKYGLGTSSEMLYMFIMFTVENEALNAVDPKYRHLLSTSAKNL